MALVDEMQCLQGVQPGALVISNGLEGHAMQMVASPKLGSAQTGQAGTNMTPQAAQEAHALANASETLKAQAQTLKVLSTCLKPTLLHLPASMHVMNVSRCLQGHMYCMHWVSC